MSPQLAQIQWISYMQIVNSSRGESEAQLRCKNLRLYSEKGEPFQKKLLKNHEFRKTM